MVQRVLSCIYMSKCCNVLTKVRQEARTLACVPLKRQLTSIKHPRFEHIYTDGSVRKNEGYMGIGVFFGDNDFRNGSYRIMGQMDSNRAELAAIYMAMTQCDTDRHTLLHTDSQTAMTMINQYFYHNASFYRFDGLLDDIAFLIDKRKTKLILHKVKGHARVYGNEKADALSKHAENRYLYLPDNNIKQVVDCVIKGNHMVYPQLY